MKYGTSFAAMKASIAFLVLWVAGVVLWGGPADPDTHMSVGQIAGVFLIFLAWSLSVLSWGRLWSAVLGMERLGPWSMAIGLGSAGASVAAMTLGHLGLIGYRFFPLLFAFLLLGPAACAVYGTRHGLARLGFQPRWSLVDWPPLLVLFAILATWLGAASLCNGTTDPFFYHLLGPRQWVDAGRIEMRFGYASTFHCSYWEYLIVWGIHVLGAPEGKGLIEGQLFGQWLHLFFGVGGAAVAAAAILQRLGLRRAWIPVALIAALAPTAFSANAVIAKNDFGIMAWSLAGVLILCQEEIRRRDALIAGIFFGMAVFGKFTTAVSVFGFGVAWAVIALRKRPALLMYASLGALAAAIPILARNAYFTGNPLFPFFNSEFHNGWLGPHESIGAVDSKGRWVASAFEIWHNVKGTLAQSSPIWPLALLFPWLRFAGRKNRPNQPNRNVAFILFAGCALAIVTFGLRVFSLTVVPMYYQRWIGAGLLLVPCLAVVTMAAILDWPADRLKRWGRPLAGIWLALVPTAVAVALALPVAKPMTWETFLDIPPEVAIRMPGIHIGGQTRAWLRLNARPGDRIVTTGEELFYYVANLDISSVLHQPVLDRALDGIEYGQNAIPILRAMGVKYLVDIIHWDTRFYGPFAAVMMNYVFYRHPEAIVFQDEQSVIIDVDRIAEENEQACVAPVGDDAEKYLQLYLYDWTPAATYRACVIPPEFLG